MNKFYYRELLLNHYQQQLYTMDLDSIQLYLVKCELLRLIQKLVNDL